MSSVETPDPDHQLVIDTNYGSCTCGRWAMSGTVEEVNRHHPAHVKGYICPWCGEEETSVGMLRSNHWIRPEGDTGCDWCEVNQMCIGQELVLNHLRYELTHGSDPDALQHHIDRAQKKWQNAKAPQPPIFAEAQTRLLQLRQAATPPEHAPTVESEEVSLW